MPPHNHSHLSTRPEVRRPSHPQIRTVVLECSEGMVIAVPIHRPSFRRAAPTFKSAAAGKLAGSVFAAGFRSLFCNADDGEGRTFCFDEGLPASTTGVCDALKDSLPEAVRRLPAHTAGRYRVPRMSLGRWATAISQFIRCAPMDGHRLGRRAAPQAGGRVASWTSSSFPHLIRSPRRRGRAARRERSDRAPLLSWY